MSTDNLEHPNQSGDPEPILPIKDLKEPEVDVESAEQVRGGDIVIQKSTDKSTAELFKS
jgi:hypothetical protein